MKRDSNLKRIAAAATVAAVMVAGLVVRTVAHEDQPFRKHGLLLDRFQALGVTDEQKTRIKQILREHQPAVQPLLQKAVTERRALRDVIQAETLNEPAIRAQSAKVAAIEADLAVARACVAQDLRKVLTAEQIEQLKDWQADFYERVDRIMEHVGQRMAP